MVKPRLLVTRFAPHALRLANLLNAQGIYAIAQPLLGVQKSEEFANPCAVLTKAYDYIIAVSSNAVDYTTQALAESPWPISCYLAVGKATQTRLQDVTHQQVIAPQTKFSSEGLLDLACLDNLQGKRVLILRGTGGRELLAQTLIARGAVVEYYQSYQRVALNLCGSVLVEQWQQKNLNGVIISSAELLRRLLAIVPEKELGWLKKLTVYVPSARLAELALLSGWDKVQVFPGIEDQQVLDYFK